MLVRFTLLVVGISETGLEVDPSVLAGVCVRTAELLVVAGVFEGEMFVLPSALTL